MPPKTANSKAPLKTTDNKVNIKLKRSEWLAIEEPLSPNDLGVIQSLLKCALEKASNTKNDSKSSRVTLTVLGGLYEKVRPSLVDANMVQSLDLKVLQSSGKPAKKTKIKPEKKADILKMNAALTRLNIVMNDFFNDNPTDELVLKSSAKSNYVEIRGLVLIRMILHIIKHHNKYASGELYVKALSVIVTTERFIDVCQNYKGSNPINPTSLMTINSQLIDDIRHSLVLAKQKFPYDGLTIHRSAPELIVQSRFDSIIPSKEIAPRKHQEKITELVVSSIATGGLFLCEAAIGSGKTTTLAGIGGVVQYYRKTNPDLFGTLVMFFTCAIPEVRNEAARLCLGAGLPFAIGSLVDEKAVITDHFSCKKPANRVVIVCSAEVCRKLLNERNEQGLKSIVLLDEPSAGADNKSKEFMFNIDLLRNPAYMTIPLSATMPSGEGREAIINSFKRKYPNAPVETVSNSEFAIPCDIVTFGGQRFYPYLGCTTKTDLESAISAIKTISFLGRLLTSDSAMDLVEKCIRHDVPNIPSIALAFASPTSMSPVNVMRYILSVLEILTTQQDSVIAAVCAENKQTDTKQLNFNNLGTTGIIEFPHTTMIADPNPVEKALEIFADLLDDLAKAGIVSVSELIDKYSDESKAFQLKQEKEEKSNSRRSTRQVDVDTKTSGLDDPPKIEFPPWAQVGTYSHVKKYTSITNYQYRSPIILENIPVDKLTNIPEKLKILLFCGIGVYGDRDVDDEYNKLVLKMAAERKLIYIVCNSMLAYGSNLSIYQIIISKQYASERSINSIVQLMGRAGRVNRSWKAKVIMDVSLLMRLLDYIKHPENHQEEEANFAEALRNPN